MTKPVPDTSYAIIVTPEGEIEGVFPQIAEGENIPMMFLLIRGIIERMRDGDFCNEVIAETAEAMQELQKKAMADAGDPPSAE